MWKHPGDAWIFGLRNLKMELTLDVLPKFTGESGARDTELELLHVEMVFMP